MGGPERHGDPDRALGRPHRRLLALRPVDEGAESASAAASTRSARTGSCRPLPSRASPTASPWRRSFEDLGDGRTRLHTQSLVDSFEGRDAWLRSGMETGVNEGYAKLDRMLADGTV